MPAKALVWMRRAFKLGAMTISAAITAAGGCFYAQYFLFIDAGIAYGLDFGRGVLAQSSGIGTVFGPLLGGAGGQRHWASHQAHDRRRAGPRSRHHTERSALW